MNKAAKELQKNFAKNMAQLITDNKIISKNMAHDLKTTSACISQFKHGKHFPRTFLLKQIADYFKVSVDYLLSNNN